MLPKFRLVPVLALMFAILAPAFGVEYENCINLSIENEFRLWWTVEGANINIKFQGKAQGYIATALYPANGPEMHPERRSDFLDLWIASTSSDPDDECFPSCLFDSYMEETDPRRDSTDNLVNKLVTKNNTFLTAEFSRPLVTNDPNDRAITLDEAIKVVWACHWTKNVRRVRDIPEHPMDNQDNQLCAGVTSIVFGKPSTCDATAEGGKFVSSAGDFRLQFKMAETGDAIDFTMEADTTGWVAIGWSDGATAHKDTDMYMGYVTGGTATVVDRWSTSKAQPATDGQNDATNPAGSEVGGVTTVSFRRALATGDNQDIPLVDKEVFIQWAYASSDSLSTQHSNAGMGKVNFFSGNSSVVVTSSSTEGTDLPPSSSPGTFTSLDGDFRLQFQPSASGDAIEFVMEADTTGWVSFGWSESSTAHKDADMYVGWISGGQATIIDTFSTAKVQPSADSQNDCQNPNGSQEGGVTKISFSRALSTGDNKDNDLADKEVFIQWAYADDTSPSTQHSHAGMGKVNFFSSGASVAFANGNGFQASEGLITTVTIVLGLYIIIRWSYRARKMYLNKKKYGNKAESSKSSNSANATQVQTGLPMPPILASKNDRRTAYYLGSQLVVPEVAELPEPSMEEIVISEEDKKNNRMTVIPIATFDAKENPSLWSNVWYAVQHLRIPRTQISVIDVVIAMLYVFVNVGWLCLWNNDNWDTATTFGYLATANALVVALPATRNSVLVWLMGVPFDKTIMFHRWLGRFTLILVGFHMLWYWPTWIEAKAFKASFFTVKNAYGLLALAGGIWLLATSIEHIRRKHFEFFFWAHFGFIAFYLFGSLHSSKFLEYAIAAAVFYIIDRLIRMFWGLYPRKTVVLNCKPGNIVQVRFPKHPMAKHRVGQYIFLNFPQISLLEWHPYTISSGPNEDTVEVHIKALGDHTNLLIDRANKKQHLWVRADGPYGRMSLNYKRYPVVVLVGGGVGITPLMSILKDAYRINMSEAMRKNKKRSPHLSHVYLVWVCPTTEVYNWFGDVISEVKSVAGHNKYPNFKAMVYITREKTVADETLLVGKPNMSLIFNRIQQQTQGDRAAVFACGPTPLVNSAWDASVARNLQGARYDFHHETFDF